MVCAYLEYYLGNIICTEVKSYASKTFKKFFFSNPHLRALFHCFLERGDKREEGREGNTDVRKKINCLSPAHTWTGDHTCQDWE